MQLNETKIDASKLYFHGSSEARVSRLDAPSFQHPFYVTTDLHYAMAFCTKVTSNTGEWDTKKTFTPADSNYVYVVTLKPSCKVFDFRDHRSPEFKKFYKIIDKDIVDWVESSSIDYSHNDIYEFINALQEEILKPIENCKDYLEYTHSYANASRLMTPALFSKSAKMIQQLKLQNAYRDYDIHQIMAPILEGLSKQGFQGILTFETDYNNDVNDLHQISSKVTTNYAIGIFDTTGLDLVSIVPMRYEWLKKINPTYWYNATNEDAYSKIKHFISLYKNIAQHTIDENKQTYIAKFKDKPDVDAIVGKFWEIRHRLKAPQNDIDWWIKKPYDDLKRFVLGYDDRNKKERRDINYRKEAMDNDAKLLGEKDGYEIWYVPTYEAMRILGRFYKGISTSWCVASDDPSFWFDIHDESEFIVLVRKDLQHDEFDKIAVEMQNGGNYFDVDDFVMWDVENEDDRYCNDELMHYAWQLFKHNGERRKGF